MKTRTVWLSTFLFAAALSPVFLQTNTCTPIGNARLAVLELWVPDMQGENVIEGFESYALFYDAESGLIVRAHLDVDFYTARDRGRLEEKVSVRGQLRIER